MSARELRAMLDRISVFCDSAFARRGEIAPMWHAVTAAGETLIEPHPTGLGKDLAAAMVRALFDLTDVVRYVYVGEAWTLEARLEERAELYRTGISEHPGRVEVVLIQGEDREAGQILAVRKIIRPKLGKPYLDPLVMVEDLPQVPRGAAMRSEGRMIGMLPARGVRQ